MKYKILDENEPILVEKILKSFSFPFNFHDGISTSERVMVDTYIYTDGETKELNHLKTQGIIGCQVNGIPYKHSVDTYNVDELFLKDANYIIRVIKSVEPYFTITGGRYHNVVRNIEIYLKDPKNKEILREVRNILKEKNLSVGVNDFLVPCNKRGISVTGYSEVCNNVYSLTKRKK